MIWSIIKWGIIVFFILLIIGAIIPDEWVYSEEELKKMRKPVDTDWIKISRELQEERKAERRERYMSDHHITESDLERNFNEMGRREFEKSFDKYYEQDDYYDEIYDENKMF